MTNTLSTGTKLAYGAGDLGASIATAIPGFFLNAFLLDVALLRPAQAALIFFLSSAWDAANDPLIGSLSDRTRSRWGRRRPWMLFGAVPFGLAYILHWIVPDLPPELLFFYYLVVAILLKTAFTAVNLPYAALTTELTSDYDERTRLNAYRFGFSILGGVAAVGLHPVIVGLFGDVKTGHVVSAMVWAFFIVASSWVAFTFTREPQRSPDELEPKYGFFEGVRITLQNRPFLIVTGVYLLAWLTLQFVQNNLLLYVRYWVDAEDQFTLLILIIQGTAFVCLALWSRVSARIGKRQTYIIGALIWVVAVLALFFVPPGTLTPIYFVAFFAGMGVSVAYLIPWSMLPDVVEYDELQTGVRREGIYYGFFVFLQQVGLSLGLGFSNLLLEGAGYVNPDVVGAAVAQPDSVLLVLRLFVSIVPAALLLISVPLAASYPITPARYAEIRAELDARHAGSRTANGL